jgi:hypothetical protein
MLLSSPFFFTYEKTEAERDGRQLAQEEFEPGFVSK